MTTLAVFKNFTSGLNEQEQVMPALFIGHGSPMNGIEDTEFTRRWTQMAKELPTPKAVLVVSARWFTKGTKITAMDFPKPFMILVVFRKSFLTCSILHQATRYWQKKQPPYCIQHI